MIEQMNISIPCLQMLEKKYSSYEESQIQNMCSLLVINQMNIELKNVCLSRLMSSHQVQLVISNPGSVVEQCITLPNRFNVFIQPSQIATFAMNDIIPSFTQRSCEFNNACNKMYSTVGFKGNNNQPLN